VKICPACTAQHNAVDWGCPACGYLPTNIDGVPILAPDLAEQGGGFRPEAFEQLATLEAAHFWFRARNQLIIWALKRFFPEMLRYLEIGCGTGFVLSGVASAFPNTEIAGSEIFSAGLPYATKRAPQAELMQMDARAIPYAEHFDVVAAFDVLEHIEADTQVLSEMHNAVRPGGGMVLTVPQHPWLWSHQDEYACHVRRYVAAELKSKVEDAGFEVFYQNSFVSLLLPLMWASRRLGRAEKESPSMSEVHIGRITNNILASVMALELFAIRNGLRFPGGGSLILVARRT